MIFLGANSFAGSNSKDLGLGGRLGTILGGRINPQFSINGELTLDSLNVKNDSNLKVAEFDLALSPLFHVHRGALEIVVGPKLGLAGGSSELTGAPGGTDKSTVSGFVFGANAGAFGAVSPSVSLGGMLTFAGRKFTKMCETPAGGAETCSMNGIDVDKVFGFVGAILF
jgi:hypothetical protein